MNKLAIVIATHPFPCIIIIIILIAPNAILFTSRALVTVTPHRTGRLGHFLSTVTRKEFKYSL
jgi:hypothetical protein